MNKHIDGDPLAEIAALRQRLSNLEAEHGELKRQATRTRRPAFSRKFLLVALPVALLLAAGGVLYAVDALFVDSSGNVGIRTQSPKYPLDVRGVFRVVNDDTNLQGFTGYWDGSWTTINSYKWSPPGGPLPLRVDGSVLSLNSKGGGNVGIGTDDPKQKLSVAGDASFSGNVNIGKTNPITKLDVDGTLNVTGNSTFNKDTTINGGLTVGGNGVVNNVFFGDVGHSQKWAGFAHKNSVSKEGYALVQEDTGKNTYINKKSGAGWIGFRIDNVDKMVLANNGNVGIGTTDPGTRSLKVAGDAEVTGSLYLPNDWAIVTTTNGLLFQHRKGNILGVNDGERLQYNVPGIGYYFLGKDKNGPSDGGYWGVWQSDLRLKRDISPIETALGKLLKLRGMTYHWNRLGLEYLTKDIESTISAGPGATAAENQKLWQKERDKRYKELSRTNVGVIAQDVEAVLPEAVTTDESGYKSVNYYELIPLVIEALKEENKASQEQARTIARQQTEIQRLTAASQLAVRQLNELREVKQKLARLEAAMSKLAGSGSSGDHNELVSLAEGSKSNPGTTLDSH